MNNLPGHTKLRTSNPGAYSMVPWYIYPKSHSPRSLHSSFSGYRTLTPHSSSWKDFLLKHTAYTCQVFIYIHAALHPNESSVLRCFEHSNGIKIGNRIMFYFSPGLPHNYMKTHSFNSLPWSSLMLTQQPYLLTKELSIVRALSQQLPVQTKNYLQYQNLRLQAAPSNFP